MSNTELSHEINRSVDLAAADLMILRASAPLLPGEWDVRATSMRGRRAYIKAAYFFRAGTSPDVSPTFLVLRSTEGYTIVVWDIVSWLQERRHEIMKFADLNEAMLAVQDMVRESIEAEDRSGPYSMATATAPSEEESA